MLIESYFHPTLGSDSLFLWDWSTDLSRCKNLLLLCVFVFCLYIPMVTPFIFILANFYVLEFWFRFVVIKFSFLCCFTAMDNAGGGRKNGEGPSGVHKFQENHDQRMDCADDPAHNSSRTCEFSESRIQISPQSSGAHRVLISNPQVCSSITFFVF